MSPSVRIALGLLLASAIVVRPAVLPAQAAGLTSPVELSNTDDARVLPRGVARFRILNAWTRFDRVFASGGDRPLGSVLSADTLGATQLPALARTQGLVQAAAGSSGMRLSLGQLVTTADSRVVVTPLAVEYGLTNRLTLDVVVPLVQTRSTILVELNPHASSANVGPNPGLTNASAYGSNVQLQGQLVGAQTALRARLQRCQSTPNDPSCATILSRQADVQSLLERTGTLSTALVQLYGTSAAQPGSPVVPITSSPLGKAIAARLDTLSGAYQSFLGTSIVIDARPTGAAVPLGAAGFESLVAAPGFGGLDSLSLVERLSIGDIELGATWQLVDRIGDPAQRAAARGGLRARAAVGGALRLGTGAPATGARLFELGTGTGQLGLVGRGAADVLLSRRWMANVAAQASIYPASATVLRAPNQGYVVFPVGEATASDGAPASTVAYTPGSAYQLELSPRYLFTDLLTLTAHYTLRRQSAERFGGSARGEGVTEQRIGFGLGYSAIAAYQRGRRTLPIEVSYVHLETIGASGAPFPKLFRDQLEARIYYRVKRKGDGL